MRRNATWVSAFWLLGFGLLGLQSGCGKGSDPAPAASIASGEDVASPLGGATSVASAGLTRAHDSRKAAVPKTPTVVLVSTNLGAFKIRLHDEQSPRTVENFLENYVARSHYDQTIFHHVERGFMIAAGGYATDMQSKPTRAWIRNESTNGLSNRRGTVAMARHPDYPHSATSQFFINVVDNPSLDYRATQSKEVTDDAFGYCVFGEVIEGMDVVDKIALAPVTTSDLFPAVPTTPVIIESIQRVP